MSYGPIVATKGLIRMSMAYSYLTTVTAGVSLMASGQRGNNMLVDIDLALLYVIISAVVGGALLIGFRYFSLYQNAKKTKLKRGEEAIEWDNRSTIAAFVDVVLGAIAVFCIYEVIDWLYVGEPFRNIPVFCFAFAVLGAGAAYLMDAWFPQAWLNGTLDKLYILGQEKALELAKSEEAKQKMLDALEAKAKALGVIDGEKVAAFCKIAKGGDASDLAYLTKIAEIVKNNDTKTLEVFYPAEE
ncbi:MAG: hypothetical protein IJT54_08145 [Candidatus Methanomethylophilaceae archaeon]|nr:hypothetical protein [Candidatus Methanomethylophilaceae archaeon]